MLYTPDHDATFASLGVAGARRVVDLWAERTAALGARDDVDYVLVFENRGPEVGATIAHPHGQIYGYDVVPPRALRRARATATPRPRSAPTRPGDRLVAARRRLAGLGAVGRDLALRAASSRPSTPVPDLPSLDDAGRDELAAVLVDVLGRLDRLFDEPMPYMLWFHQRPTDGGDWPTAWLHAHVAPLYRSAGHAALRRRGRAGRPGVLQPGRSRRRGRARSAMPEPTAPTRPSVTGVRARAG